ncbi:SigE family RNA polymerase sigma factor [Nocardioides sp. cx-173]|uniref:SigE family RNA polymerase sigma factor n=1 Tax=Nocardioides sp. cx-173 TaxID=2898796 RepID=UPI001E2C9FFB|nr:SigE family RNA polymerase sigma factor [Nocardioides sp. cx-173]MCD4527246.1 SigE family RNA polymerase sigma factor [Nocardioides sp. cx-173]UGB40377.1 SigE family RNA polymerase sigma factor [Nocardioides sp. cx-173]
MQRTDRDDFEQFARARSHELLRAGWLLTGDRHRGEDLAQETLARVFSKWSRVKAADNPAAYARTILTRIYLDSVRRRSSTEVPLADPPQARAATPDSDLRQVLVAALRELTPVDRAVVVHRYLLDADVATVARDLSLSENAVRTRSSRSLARIREHLGADFIDLTENSR